MNHEPDLLAYVRSWLGNEVLNNVRPSHETAHQLLEQADVEGVGGIIAEEFQRHFQLQEAWLQNRVESWFIGGARHLACLTELAHSLASAGLEVIALKGAALAPTAYQGHLSCRPISDLDLLIRAQDSGAVRAIADELVKNDNVWVFVDWHAHLVETHRIPVKVELCRLSVNEIWILSHPWIEGVRHLDCELQFIHLALHAFKHSCCRLIWLVDLALVLRACDLPTLISLSLHLGADRPVLVTLHLLQGMLRENVPQELLGRLRWHERGFLELARRRHNRLGWGELFLALSIHGYPKKMRYLCEYFFPSSEIFGVTGARIVGGLSFIDFTDFLPIKIGIWAWAEAGN